MSAWLVMSALGLYQVCPGCGTGSGGGGEYVLTTPLFDDLTLHLPGRSNAGGVHRSDTTETGASVYSGCGCVRAVLFLALSDPSVDRSSTSCVLPDLSLALHLQAPPRCAS